MRAARIHEDLTLRVDDIDDPLCDIDADHFEAAARQSAGDRQADITEAEH